jgi:hypothetical protein
MPGPYEHAQAGDVESHIKIIEESVKKVLHSMQLSYEYWGLCVTNNVSVYNTMPSGKDLTKSRMALWKGLSFIPQSLLAVPAIPFGTRVIARLPLELQRADSLRGVKTIYVGTAPGVKGGVLLRNPETKRTIVRVTFKPMGPNDERPSPLLREREMEVTDDESYQFDDHKNEITQFVQSESVVPSNESHVSANDEVAQSDGVRYVRAKRSDITGRYKRNHLAYFTKIGMCFVDTDVRVRFKITGVYFCSSSEVVGPATPIYQFYDVDRFQGSPSNASDYIYQPCREVLAAAYIRWDDSANMASIESVGEALVYLNSQSDVDDEIREYVTTSLSSSCGDYDPTEKKRYPLHQF